MTDKPADWAYERADAQLVKERVLDGLRHYRTAFARYIEAHEQPPVDPDLLIAREACALSCGINSTGAYLSGNNDRNLIMLACLAAIKNARSKGVL